MKYRNWEKYGEVERVKEGLRKRGMETEPLLNTLWSVGIFMYKTITENIVKL